MIINASITRLDTPGTPDAAGTIAYTQGAAVALDCFLDDVSRAQQWALDATIANASSVCYVPRDDVQAAGLSIGAETRLLINLEGESPVLYEAVRVRTRVLGSIDHYEIFLQVL